jgi:hypothetical protein
VCSICMHSLHDVREMNVKRSGHVCLPIHLSVCVIPFKTCWMDLDEILYGHCAIREYPKIVLLCFI